MRGDTFWFFFTALAMLVVGFLTGVSCGASVMKIDAIERGFAQYNPTTAKFEWKESNESK